MQKRVHACLFLRAEINAVAKLTRPPTTCGSVRSVQNVLCGEKDMGTLMMVDHMKRTHGVGPSDVRYIMGKSKGGVRQVP